MGLIILFLAANLGAAEVTLELKDIGGGGQWVSLGLPAPAGLPESTQAQVFAEGSQHPLARSVVRPILAESAGGAGRQVRSWLIQVPRASLGGATRLRVTWGAGGSRGGPAAREQLGRSGRVP